MRTPRRTGAILSNKRPSSSLTAVNFRPLLAGANPSAQVAPSYDGLSRYSRRLSPGLLNVTGALTTASFGASMDPALSDDAAAPQTSQAVRSSNRVLPTLSPTSPKDVQVVFERPASSKDFVRQNVINLAEDLDVYLELVDKTPFARRKPRGKHFADAEDKLAVAVRDASELLVWADQHSPTLWEAFAEFRVGDKLVSSLEASNNRAVRLQILQTLSIIIHSIRKDTLERYIYPSDLPNRVLRSNFDFTDDEILFYYMSIIRSLASTIDQASLKYFVAEKNANVFPLYTQVLQFFDHRDAIVRIAVRNITLSLFLNGGPDVLAFSVHGTDDPDHYFRRLSRRVVTICDAVVKVFVESNTKEPSNHKLSALGDVFLELHNMLEYFNEALSISPLVLGPVLGGILMETYRPLIARVTSQVKGARTKGRTASATFAGLISVIAMTLDVVDNKILSSAITSEMGMFIESIGYSPLYGVKAIACTVRDERVVHLALCAMECIVGSKYMSHDNLATARYLLSEAGLSRALAMLKPQRELFPQHDEDHSSDLKEDRKRGAGEPVVVDVKQLAILDNVTAREEPTTSVFDNAQIVETKNIGTTTSLTKQLANLELGSEFHVADNLEDVLLLVFLRPSTTRSTRVLQSGARLILAIARKTSSPRSCAIFVRRMLDEHLESMARFLEAHANKLNGSSIEALYEMFSNALRNRAGLTEPPQTLERTLLDPWVSVQQLRHEESKRRRGWTSFSPTEPSTRQGDVDSFFVLFWVYTTLCGYLAAPSPAGMDGSSLQGVSEQVEALFNSVRSLFEKQGPNLGGVERKTKIVLGILAMVIEHSLDSISRSSDEDGLHRTRSAMASGKVYQELTARIRENRDTAMQSRGDLSMDDEEIEQAFSGLPTSAK